MTVSTSESELAFVFTDIEGSTQRWERSPDLMRALLAAHDEITIRCVQKHGGSIVKGLGDGVLATFPTLSGALAALLEYQIALQEPLQLPGSDGPVAPPKVRSAVHWGAAESRDGDYYGPALNRAARTVSVGHGGQILLTHAVYLELDNRLPEGAEVVDLGYHRLKDIDGVERLYQLVHPALERDFPPLRSLRVERHNLPQRITSFIGREDSVADIHAALTEGRLLTLCGPGGAGKTRLAIEAADRLVERYPDGVWMVSFESVSEGAELPRVVCETLGVPEVPNQSLEASLGNWLAEKDLLLVLDNCEHLTRESALLINQGLRRASKMRVLATSREPLGITGERMLQVTPLATPSVYRRDVVDHSPAVALFRDRARLRDPSFEITAENAEALFNLCAQLDGLPLGLELAAAWVDTMGVDQIGEHLQELPSADPLAHSRQRSLEELIAWSYSLLDEEQAAVFRQLSVFSGGWKIEAAAEVCVPAGRLPVAIIHAQLARKSLIEMSIQPGERGGRRQHFLSTVHEFAHRRLEETGETEEAARRHSAWALKFVTGADDDLQSANASIRRQQLDAEQANLRTALQRFCARSNGVDGGRLFLEIWRNWFQRGALSEVKTWTEKLLALPKLADETDHQQLERILGAVYWAQGNYSQARLQFERCLESARERNDPLETAKAVNNLALVVIQQGETESAMDLFGECVEAYRKAGEEPGVARALTNLGSAAQDLERYSEGVAPLEEALQLFEKHGDIPGVTAACHNLGLVSLGLGDSRRAGELLRRALALRLEQDDQIGMPRALDALARHSMASARWEQALLLAGKADALRRELKVEPGAFDLAHHRKLQEEASKHLTKDNVEGQLACGQDMSLNHCFDLVCDNEPEAPLPHLETDR